MENENIELDKVKTIKNNLNNLVSKGGQIKRQDILNAEEISYNNIPPSSILYDEYGFISNKENPKKK